MRYLPRLLNDREFFQELNSALENIKKPNEKLTLKIEHFLYRASCVLYSLERMYSAEQASVNIVRSYIKQIKFPDNGRISVSVEPLFEVYSQIPAALSQLVNMQNLLLEIFQGLFEIKKSVPASFRKAVTNGLTKYGFDKYTSTLVSAYWEKNGLLIRNLRDLNEHYIALVDHTFFSYTKDPGQILVLLPDNPETKSGDKFLYKNELDAYETIANGLIHLDALVSMVLEKLEYKPKRFESSLYMGHMGSLEEEQERTLGLMITITKVEKTESGSKLHLDTVEIQQIIPAREGAGNIAVRKLKTDSEIDKS